jgi:GT2 family glycosyltransferase
MVRSSIIIPVYNRPALTRQCLQALLASRANPADIIVVDDGSDPPIVDSLGPFPEHVRIVRHSANAGFAVTCNDGAAIARTEYLVFLNNDTLPQAGWLEALERYASDHPRAAVVGSKLLYPNLTVQHAGVVICQDRYPRHAYTGFPADHPAVNKARQFQCVTAASALVRRDAFEHAGGFDTQFANGYEDVDLCLRLRELDYEVHYCPESIVHHLEAATRGDLPATVEHNDKLFRERWAQRVVPDDVDFYLEDGLLEINFGPGEVYPARLHVSPLLAVVDGERPAELERLLNLRARQVFELMKENIRLSTMLLEMGAEPQSKTPDSEP